MFKLLFIAVIFTLLLGCAGVPVTEVPDNYDAEIEAQIGLFWLEQILGSRDYY